MKNILLFLLLSPICSYSQTSHYDSLYAKGLITKADYMTLMHTYKPVDPNAEKKARYDSLYNKGVISKDEHDALVNKISLPQPYDTLQVLIDRYDSMYNTKQIEKKEYYDLMEKAKTTYTHLAPTMNNFDPKAARATARRQTTGGVVTMLLADVFMAVAIGRASSSPERATDIPNIFSISFSLLFRGVGVGLFAHTATLRRRAERYEANEQLLQRR